VAPPAGWGLPAGPANSLGRAGVGVGITLYAGRFPTREAGPDGTDDSAYLADWEFHQATGMMSVYIGTHDMGEAAMHLLALAARRHESPHDSAHLIVSRQLRLG